MSVRRLSYEGVDTRRYAGKDIELLMGVDWEIPHRLEKEMCGSRDARLQKGVDCEILRRLKSGNLFLAYVF